MSEYREGEAVYVRLSERWVAATVVGIGNRWVRVRVNGVTFPIVRARIRPFGDLRGLAERFARR